LTDKPKDPQIRVTCTAELEAELLRVVKKRGAPVVLQALLIQVMTARQKPAYTANPEG
jgi:hypothetical protein